jgi:hypothetical protein
MILILMVSSPHHHDIMADPPATAQTFLEQKTLGKVYSHLRQALRPKFNVNFDPSKALVAALHEGHFLCDRISCPSNASLFFCGRAGPLSSPVDAIRLHLQYTGGGGLTDKGIDRVLHQERYPPMDVHVCAEQIQRFNVVLAEIFGETTPLS